MFRFADKVAVVTGAASGIGRELALGLAHRGCRLVLADFNAKGLAETVHSIQSAGGTATGRTLDVSDRKGVERFARDTLKEHGRVDILINNAGITMVGRFADISIEEFRRVADVNFWGVVYATKAFLPHLLERPEARLVNLSSVFGFIGVPLQTTYCSTKFAVRGFTESLRREVRGSGLSVMCVHPGGIRTNIARNARYTKEQEHEHERRAGEFERMARTSPHDAAETIIRGMEKNKERVLIGADARLISLLYRLFPVLYGTMIDRYAKKSAAETKSQRGSSSIREVS